MLYWLLSIISQYPCFFLEVLPILWQTQTSFSKSRSRLRLSENQVLYLPQSSQVFTSNYLHLNNPCCHMILLSHYSSLLHFVTHLMPNQLLRSSLAKLFFKYPLDHYLFCSVQSFNFIERASHTLLVNHFESNPPAASIVELVPQTWTDTMLVLSMLVLFLLLNQIVKDD